MFGSDDRSIVQEAVPCYATAAGLLAPPTTATGFLHVTLPAGHVRDIEPCALGLGVSRARAGRRPMHTFGADLERADAGGVRAGRGPARGNDAS